MGNPESKMNNLPDNPITNKRNSISSQKLTSNFNILRDNEIKKDLFRRFSNYKQPYAVTKNKKETIIKKSNLKVPILNNIKLLAYSETIVERVLNDCFSGTTHLNFLLTNNLFVNKVNVEKVKADIELIPDYLFQVEESTKTLNSYLKFKKHNKEEFYRGDFSENNRFSHIFEKIDQKKIDDKFQNTFKDYSSTQATVSCQMNKENDFVYSELKNKIEEQIYVKNKIKIKGLNINKKRNDKLNRQVISSNSTILTDSKNPSIHCHILKNDSTEVVSFNKSNQNQLVVNKIKTDIQNIRNTDKLVKVIKQTKLVKTKNNIIIENDHRVNPISNFEAHSGRFSKLSNCPTTVNSKSRNMSLNQNLNTLNTELTQSNGSLSRSRCPSPDNNCLAHTSPTIRNRNKSQDEKQKTSRSPVNEKNAIYSMRKTPSNQTTKINSASSSSKFLKVDLRNTPNNHSETQREKEIIFDMKNNPKYKIVTTNNSNKKPSFTTNKNKTMIKNSSINSSNIEKNNFTTIKPLNDTSPNLSKGSYVDIIKIKKNLNKSKSRSKSNDRVNDQKGGRKEPDKDSISNKINNLGSKVVNSIRTKTSNYNVNNTNKLTNHTKNYSSHNKPNTKLNSIIENDLVEPISQENKIVMKLYLNKENKLHKISNSESLKTERSSKNSEKLKKLKNLKTYMEKNILKLTNEEEDLVHFQNDKFNESTENNTNNHNSFNYTHFYPETCCPTKREILDVISDVSNENDDSDNRFTNQKRQTPEFDIKDKYETSLSFRNLEDARFSFNMYNVKKSIHEPNIRYNLSFDDKTGENELRDFDYVENWSENKS